MFLHPNTNVHKINHLIFKILDYSINISQFPTQIFNLFHQLAMHLFFQMSLPHVPCMEYLPTFTNVTIKVKAKCRKQIPYMESLFDLQSPTQQAPFFWKKNPPEPSEGSFHHHQSLHCMARSPPFERAIGGQKVTSKLLQPKDAFGMS